MAARSQAPLWAPKSGHLPHGERQSTKPERPLGRVPGSGCTGAQCALWTCIGHSLPLMGLPQRC